VAVHRGGGARARGALGRPALQAALAMAGLSNERAERLRPLLESLSQSQAALARVSADPVEFPRRYTRAEDIEVSALLSTCLAYGRVDLFKPRLEDLLGKMGTSPADFASHFEPEKRAHQKVFEGFVYRFNLAGDLGLLTAAMGAVLREHGRLQGAFA